MSTSMKLFATLAAAVFLTACESSSNGRTNARGENRTRATSNDVNNPIHDAPAVYNTIRDCRVLLYDPRTSATIIMVNKRHAWRESEQGQLNITNGSRNRSYKILTDKQIDALLETFKQRGSSGIQERYQDRHAALLSHKSRRGDPFKGIIIVENGGKRHSFIARTPRSDPLAIKKYDVFRQMREAIFVFARSGLSERVGSSATGTAPMDQLTIPRDNSNRR